MARIHVMIRNRVLVSFKGTLENTVIAQRLM